MGHITRPDPDTNQILIRKKRKCLKCWTVFDSEWASERICKACKTSPDYERAEGLGGQFG